MGREGAALAGVRMHSGGMHVGEVRSRSHSDSAGGAASRVRAAKSSELG